MTSNKTIMAILFTLIELVALYQLKEKTPKFLKTKQNLTTYLDFIHLYTAMHDKNIKMKIIFNAHIDP